MSKTLIGLLVAAVLAYAALDHGFGGFLLAVIFLAAGGFLGATLENGSLNLDEAWKSLVNKKGSSSN
ncbi:hypothetical protein ACN08X_04760 [Rothia sp. P6271]|uniref:hypothetical protein n=1 Tax=unclassified Rothia (in: high G+C Gram-positive bacteria) TaxID=2689056 RepID=UPI003AC42A95